MVMITPVVCRARCTSPCARTARAWCRSCWGRARRPPSPRSRATRPATSPSAAAPRSVSPCCWGTPSQWMSIYSTTQVRRKLSIHVKLGSAEMIIAPLFRRDLPAPGRHRRPAGLGQDAAGGRGQPWPAVRQVRQNRWGQWTGQYDKGQAALRHYANQPVRSLWLLRRRRLIDLRH